MSNQIRRYFEGREGEEGKLIKMAAEVQAAININHRKDAEPGPGWGLLSPSLYPSPLH